MQQTLFDFDEHGTWEDEGGQWFYDERNSKVATMLRRLRNGKASTEELKGDPYGHRFSIEISTLRKLGFTIKDTLDREAGGAWYELIAEPKRLNIRTTNAMKEAYYKSGHWENLRTWRVEYDGEQCVICRSTDDLQVHHIVYRLFDEDPRADVMTCCEQCHRTIHQNSKIAFPPFVRPGIAQLLKG